MNKIQYDQDVTQNPRAAKKSKHSGIIGLLIKHNIAKDTRTATLILIGILLISALVIIFNLSLSSDTLPENDQPAPESLL